MPRKEDVVAEDGEMEEVESPWRLPRPAPREFTQEELDATRMYLSEIGFSPLLTAQEEVYFARRVIQGDAAPATAWLKAICDWW
jgi:RNA polymerase nonessential primary-like sigma factor